MKGKFANAQQLNPNTVQQQDEFIIKNKRNVK